MHLIPCDTVKPNRCLQNAKYQKRRVWHSVWRQWPDEMLMLALIIPSNSISTFVVVVHWRTTIRANIYSPQSQCIFSSMNGINFQSVLCVMLSAAGLFRIIFKFLSQCKNCVHCERLPDAGCRCTQNAKNQIENKTIAGAKLNCFESMRCTMKRETHSRHSHYVAAVASDCCDNQLCDVGPPKAMVAGRGHVRSLKFILHATTTTERRKQKTEA